MDQALLIPDARAIADYIHLSKYARHLPEEERREIPGETIDRVEAMHLRRYPALAPDIKWAFDQVRANKVLPSMRSMQFGGKAVESNHARLYNCGFSLCDRIRFFQEAMYLLLCGTGVGFSVQFDHVEKLPALGRVDPQRVKHHIVADTIEGWADALGDLINSYVKGYWVEFSYHKIRPAGTPLKTSGGRAPGHIPLKLALDKIRGLLDHAQGRQLRPIECYRIMCLAADAVLSGGIRRSAMLCLFSLDDGEMMNTKTGKWFESHPEYQNSNNSVILKRDEIKKPQFKRIFARTREWGEPGFYFADDLDSGANPCVEIGMNPVLTIDAKAREYAQAWATKRSLPVPKVKDGERLTGWSFCNLTTQNAALFTSPEDFYAASRAAAIIGTIQAGYQDFPYLGWVTEAVVRREALLGVSMTGMVDSPDIAFSPEYQRIAAKVVRDTNAEFAAKLGIEPAARLTCVKPEGTGSLKLGCVGSGISGHPGRRYFRRVTANPLERPFQHFRSINPHMCEDKHNAAGDWVITFPVQAPDKAVLVDDLTALQFLGKVMSTQQNWVLPGTARPDSSPGVNHNVSNTVVVAPDEWDDTMNFLWDNRKFFTGVALLAKSGDKDFAFAPREVVANEADEARWNYLIANYKPVDYTKMVETEDETDLKGELACAAGGCEIR